MNPVHFLTKRGYIEGTELSQNNLNLKDIKCLSLFFSNIILFVYEVAIFFFFAYLMHL